MLLNDTSAHPPPDRRRVLLLGSNGSSPDNIPTFLNAMGCTCTAVPSDEDALAMMGREPFDAVLIDLGPSMKLAEGTILRIPATRSSLWG
jgi:CheY-like chemotaxis protein